MGTEASPPRWELARRAGIAADGQEKRIVGMTTHDADSDNPSDLGDSPTQTARMTGIQPELWIDHAEAAVAFYQAAFGARVLHRVGEGDNIVAQLAVGDAAFWISPGGAEGPRFSPQAIGGATGRVLLVVDDPDAVFAQAVGAGATAASEVTDEHGWRLGRIFDPFGHEWEIGRPTGMWPPR